MIDPRTIAERPAGRWWKDMRIAWAVRGVRKMTDARWRLALEIAKTRRISPQSAADRVVAAE